jgi:hypothetical protein
VLALSLRKKLNKTVELYSHIREKLKTDVTHPLAFAIEKRQ